MSNNTTSHCDNGSTPCRTEVDIVFVAFHSVVFAVGLVLNLVALIVFFRCTKSRSHTIVYMTNLALADLFLVLTLPVRIYHHLGYRDLSQNVCGWMGLVLLVNMYVSILLLTCMCFDRCMAVSFPMSYRIQQVRKKAPLVCLGVWVLITAFGLPAYLLKHSQVKNEEQRCFENRPIYTIPPMTVFFTLTMGFAVPLAVVVVCSWGLIRAVRRSTVAQTDLVDCKKIQKMVATHLFIFLLCFLPYHCVLAALSLYKDDVPPGLLVAFRYSLMLACLNAMLDPIVYYFTTETFQKKMAISSASKEITLEQSQFHGGGTRGPINTCVEFVAC